MINYIPERHLSSLGYYFDWGGYRVENYRKRSLYGYEYLNHNWDYSSIRVERPYCGISEPDVFLIDGMGDFQTS